MVNIFAGSSSSPAEKPGLGEAKDLFTSNYEGVFIAVNAVVIVGQLSRI